MSVRFLYIAEIVGSAGLFCVKKMLPALAEKYAFDIAAANADSVTGGSGLCKNHAAYLRKLGLSVLTGGDCILYKKDLVECMARNTATDAEKKQEFNKNCTVVRPLNYPRSSPGCGWKLCSAGRGVQVAVVSLLGAAGFSRVHANNPFECLDAEIELLRSQTPCVVVDFHGASTAEKKAFAAFADGRVSAVIGSHGKVQTADERILPRGTAAITDAGRTGCVDSVGGLQAQSRIGEYITGVPAWKREIDLETENCAAAVQGVFIDIADSGAAASIERFSVLLDVGKVY